MASAQYNRYIWLLDTIRSNGRITKEQIDRKWASSRYNENHETVFPERSFHRCKRDIETIFDIEIKCQRSREGRVYYIPESDSNSKTKQWLISQFAMSQFLDASRELQDQILYENIPEGTQYLTTIVEALRDSKMLLVSHLRFDSTEPPHVFHLAPLCLKVFKHHNVAVYLSSKFACCGIPAVSSGDGDVTHIVRTLPYFPARSMNSSRRLQ